MKKNLTEEIANKNRFFKMIYIFSNQIKMDNVSSYAASCAFFIFLSLIPCIILLCSILPFTPLKEEDLLAILTNNFPETMGSLLTSLVAEVYDKSIGVLSIAAVTTLWSAGKGVNALITGLNAIEHIENKRNTIVMRLFSSLYTLIFLTSIILFLVLMVYGNLAMEVLIDDYPRLALLFGIFVRFRSLITILIMTIVFMILYAELPNTRMKIRLQFIGALFTALGWTLFSFVFSLYVENFNGFTMYGSFTTIIILMFWLYTCMYIVFIGANLNKYLRPIMILVDKKYRDNRSMKKSQGESLEE